MNYGKSPLEPGNWADEMRASIWALREKGAVLSPADQMLLAQDAIDRVSEAGFFMSQSKKNYVFSLLK
jgi:hypothetical protein